jgi:hypothetical protein
VRERAEREALAQVTEHGTGDRERD